LKIIFPEVLVSANICPATVVDGADVPLLLELIAESALLRSLLKDGNPWFAML